MRPFMPLLVFLTAAFLQGREAQAEDRSAWDKRLSIELSDTDVSTALQIVAEATGINIILAKGVSGRINHLRLTDVTAEQLFQLILRLHGLYAEREGNIVIVYPLADYVSKGKPSEINPR